MGKRLVHVIHQNHHSMQGDGSLQVEILLLLNYRLWLCQQQPLPQDSLPAAVAAAGPQGNGPKCRE